MSSSAVALSAMVHRVQGSRRDRRLAPSLLMRVRLAPGSGDVLLQREPDTRGGGDRRLVGWSLLPGAARVSSPAGSARLRHPFLTGMAGSCRARGSGGPLRALPCLRVLATNSAA